MNLLSSNTEHVLVNAVNSIRVLCDMRPENQTEAAACGAVPTLIELLSKYARSMVTLFIFPCERLLISLALTCSKNRRFLQ